MTLFDAHQVASSTSNSANLALPDIPSSDLGLDMALIHPLDRPLAGFNNHSGIKAPIGASRNAWGAEPGTGTGTGTANSVVNGYDGRESEGMTSQEKAVSTNQLDGTTIKNDRMGQEERDKVMAASPPRVNPFHLLSHPDGEYHPLPFSPADIHTSTGESMSGSTSAGTSSPYLSSGNDVGNVVNGFTASTTNGHSTIAPIHITQVSKGKVVVVSAIDNAGEPVTPRPSFMEKVGGRFRRKAGAGGDGFESHHHHPTVHGDANVPPPAPFKTEGLNVRRDGGAMMHNAPNSVGEAPPSPPISDEEHASEETGDLLEEDEEEEDEEEDEGEESFRGRNPTEGTTSSRILQPGSPDAVILGPPILDARSTSYTEEPEPMSTADGMTPPNMSLFSSVPRRTSTTSSVSTFGHNYTPTTGIGMLSGIPPPPIPPGPTRAGSLAAANIRRKQSAEAGLSTSESPSRATAATSTVNHREGNVPVPLESPLAMPPRTVVELTSTPTSEAMTLPAPTTSATIPESGYLHPSSASIVSNSSSSIHGIPSPTRRNTIGTYGKGSPMQATRLPLLQARSHMEVPTTDGTSAMIAVPGVDGAALDSDILAEADKLRKERLERRQKQRQGSVNEDQELIGVKKRSPSGTSWRADDAGGSAGMAGTPVGGPQPRLGMGSPSTATSAVQKRRMSEKADRLPGNVDREQVLVGNLIGEDHVNYVLMYNMLTGIRIGVSRCQAKIKRPLTEEDYTARHKFSFDVVGNELTPSARYDFKFKDYAPWVFRELRDDHFHLDPADYLLSLTAKYILSELGSPGKSGSFFYFSRDYRFIIKTIHHSEHKFLRRILKDYHNHVRSNPHTLLSRFYGLHRVKLPRGRKIHFVIMNNLFPPHRDIHETYDLKGSTYGREFPEEKVKENSKVTLKDLNWVHRGRRFELGPEKRALFAEQLRRDMEFLKKMKVMDYSLLIGLHNMERGNRDNIRENQLTVFHPDVNGLTRRKPSSVKGGADASAVRKAIRRSDPKALGSATQQLPNSDSADRRHFLFYQDEGGLRATDEANQPLDLIYYLGVIDILTPYNTAKRLEHFWKGMTEDMHMISCVPPGEYGDRFLHFLMKFMRGEDDSIRSKTE